MKKIIKNSVYDTSTAQVVAAMETRGTYQALYLKRSNEFFVHQRIDGYESIQPLTYDQARAWSKEILSEEHYNKLFGEIPEDSEKMNVSIRLRVDTYQKLQRLSARTAMPASGLIELMLQGAYDQYEDWKNEEENLYSGD